MPDRWAFVVAVEKYLHPDLGTVPYVEAGAKVLAETLAAAGYPKANQILLFGPHATKTAVESRLRTLRKGVKKGDAVLALLAGRGAEGRFACWDTLPDDAADTSLSLAEFAAALGATKAGEITVLLDPAPDADGLETLFADSPKAVALASAGPGETAHTTAGLRGSAWLHLVTEAFAGRAPKATDGKGCVTAVSLHRYVEDELPRVLRKHFDGRVEQTPLLFGEQNGGFVLTDVSDRLGDTGELDAGRLKRVVFRSESHGRVKDLAGFRKTYSVPDADNAYNRKFVIKLAAADLKADLDAVFESVREHLGYKRKDIDVSADGDGVGYFRAPDFEYSVTVALDPEDPSQVTWRREVGQFADPEFVRSAGFDAVFGKLFDQLAFEFQSPVDVPALVDRLEDRPPKGVKVRVSSDGTACDVTLAGFVGRVTVGRAGLTVRGRAGDSAGLLDQFLKFVQSVGPVGEPLALPPKG